MGDSEHDTPGDQSRAGSPKEKRSADRIFERQEELYYAAAEKAEGLELSTFQRSVESLLGAATILFGLTQAFTASPEARRPLGGELRTLLLVSSVLIVISILAGITQFVVLRWYHGAHVRRDLDLADTARMLDFIDDPDRYREAFFVAADISRRSETQRPPSLPFAVQGTTFLLGLVGLLVVLSSALLVG